MLRRILFRSLVAVALGPATLLAQTDSDDATASVQIVGTVAVTATEQIDFGFQPKTAGLIRSSVIPTRAAWSVAMDGFHDVQIDFILPAQLADGAGSVLPVTFGATSAHLMDGFADVAFDPASGLGINDVAGTFDVFLGEDTNRDLTGDVTVDVTDGIAGQTYQAVITMTVTIL